MSYIAGGGSGGGGGGTVTAVTASAPLASSGGNTPDISGATLVTSAAALTANRLVIGGGLQATSALGSLGTTTTLLHGNAAGAPTFATVAAADFTNQGTTTTLLHGNAAGAASFAAVSLTADVSGVLPVANGGTAVVSAADTGYLWGGMPGVSCATPATTNVAVVANASEVRAVQFVLPYKITIGRASITVSAASGSTTVTCGIYDSAGTTKLIDTGTFNGGSGAAGQTVTFGQVTLNPGIYWYAQSASTQTTLTVVSFTVGANIAAIMNGETAKLAGLSPNAASSGVLPSSLGTMTALSYSPVACLFKP